MALARLALKNLQQRVSASSSLVRHGVSESRVTGSLQRERCWNNEALRSYANVTAATDKDKPGDSSNEVAVTERKRSRLFPRRQRRRSWPWSWRGDDRDFAPALSGNYYY